MNTLNLNIDFSNISSIPLEPLDTLPLNLVVAELILLRVFCIYNRNGKGNEITLWIGSFFFFLLGSFFLE